MTRAVIALLLAPFLLVVGVAMTATGSGALAVTGDGQVICTPTGTVASISAAGVTLTPEQSTNATIIRDVGVALAVPARGQAIAIATAMVESTLRNLDHGDRDSLGLFQQRPSQGWGTPAQIMDPVHASQKFYEALLKVTDWRSMGFSEAAQAVQRSGYPERYGTWEAMATGIITALADTDSACALDDTDTTLPDDVTANLPDDFTLPADTPADVVTAITWALRQLGTSYHWGGSCTDPHSSNLAKHCDCSSLTQQSYRAAGIGLTRTTRTQIHEGTRVRTPDDLKPGDLIFLPGHVGMYLGDGLVIHAPHTGDVVKISQIHDYWTDKWVTARRIVN